MPKPYLVGVYSVVSLLALGCSSSSDQGNAAVDPASQDFCLEWANGVCRLAYLCVDASAQDAAFHARYGNSKDGCWQSVEKFCTSNQTGSNTFGPSCGPGKKVNQELASACSLSLDAETCELWQAAPAGACTAVCSTPVQVTGAGGAGAGGSGNVITAGTGAGGSSNPSAGSGNTSTGSLPTAKDFCLAEESVQCDRVFECAPEQASQLGTLADCKASSAADCASGELCANGYDAAKAARCVAATKAATCEQLMGNPPSDCLTACL